MKTTIYDSQGTVIGWIAQGGCDNDRCLAAVAEGRTYHATPAASRVLPDYHFHTSVAAEAALQRAARPQRGGQDAEAAHAQGLHDDGPREGCPECERRRNRT